MLNAIRVIAVCLAISACSAPIKATKEQQPVSQHATSPKVTQPAPQQPTAKPVATPTKSTVTPVTVRALATSNTLQQIGQIQHPSLNEISGITYATPPHNGFWVINDSGDNANLYGIDKQGKLQSRWQLNNAKNRDWEDITRYHWHGKNWIIIGDIGDNQAKYAHNTLYIVEEPSTPPTTQRIQQHRAKRRIRYRYEDGARDAESLAVDSENQRIIIISKRDNIPVVYTLPLFADDNTIHTAQRVSTLKQLPSPRITDLLANPRFGFFLESPTAMDISPNGRQAAILTYQTLYLYERQTDQSWEEAFQQMPKTLATHTLPQAESISFTADGTHLIVTSERAQKQQHVPLLRF